MMRAALMLAVVFALAAPAGPLAAGGSGDTRVRLEEVRKQIEDLRKALAGARDRHARLREELRASELAIGEASRELRDLERRQREGREELRALRARETRARESLGRHRELLGQQIVASYAMGHQGHLKLILSQQDPATLGRMLAYYRYFHRARLDRIAEVDASLREIAALEDSIASETEALERVRAEQVRQVATLEDSRRSRTAVLATLEAEIRTREQDLETLVQDERGLSELVAKLREALAVEPAAPVEPGDRVPFGKLKGKLPWPVEGPVIARFGTHRRADSLPWRGVVIAAAEGSEVRSIYGGRVVFADWMRGFGLLVIVDHGQGYMSLYGYNQSLYKNAGDPVRQGELIATVGDSGGRDSPGLYFEIRHDGRPDNPQQWVRAAAR